MIWKDVKLSDFALPKERQLTSLFDGDASSTDNRHSRSEVAPDEHPR